MKSLPLANCIMQSSTSNLLLFFQAQMDRLYSTTHSWLYLSAHKQCYALAMQWLMGLCCILCMVHIYYTIKGIHRRQEYVFYMTFVLDITADMHAHLIDITGTERLVFPKPHMQSSSKPSHITGGFFRMTKPPVQACTLIHACIPDTAWGIIHGCKLRIMAKSITIYITTYYLLLPQKNPQIVSMSI